MMFSIHLGAPGGSHGAHYCSSGYRTDSLVYERRKTPSASFEDSWFSDAGFRSKFLGNSPRQSALTR
jgi:hypothetical protein